MSTALEDAPQARVQASRAEHDEALQRLTEGLDRLQERLISKRPVDANERVLLSALAVSLRQSLDEIEPTPGSGSGGEDEARAHQLRARLDSVTAEFAGLLAPAAHPPARVDRASEATATPGRAAVRDLRRRAGRVLSITAVILLLFPLFEFAATAVIEARGQRLLLSAFQTTLANAQRTGAVGAPAPRAGEPIGIIDISKIGLVQVVVEGDSAQALKQGPGHLPTSALPGEAGNAIVAGRRTTYGAPFRRLDRLAKGDVVVVTTPEGRFRYVVNRVVTIRAGQRDVLAQSAAPRLTLITSSPAYVPSARLAVEADLVGPALPPTRIEPTTVGSEKIGLSGDGGAVAAILLWAELIALAVLVSRRLYRRWPNARRAAYLLTTPVLLALLFLLFGSLDRLLPATL